VIYITSLTILSASLPRSQTDGFRIGPRSQGMRRGEVRKSRTMTIPNAPTTPTSSPSRIEPGDLAYYVKVVTAKVREMAAIEVASQSDNL
jgi:hypothetical protein